MAGAGKSRVKVLQKLGRGIRRKKIGLNRVYILDFMDRSHIYLFQQYKKRLEYMEEVDATIIGDEYKFNNMIYEHSENLKELKDK